MLEIQQKKPIFIKQKLVDTALYSENLGEKNAKWSLKAGASVLFKSFHLFHMDNLFILWCIKMAY
jgi:hypothetical protein